MGIEALNCQCCGAPLKIADSTCECEYCGRINIIGGNAGKYINQLNKANRLRQQCEFDHAYNIYDIILSENTPSADILWSQALCEYGIEYVPDPVSSKFFPTLHRIKDISFLDSRCFREALELADDKQKEQIKKSGEEIERIQEEYLSIAANEAPYDAFICYKEKDSNSGEITEDVELAKELYNELTQNGFKVFFARETLKNKLSVDYEPYIFAALKSARAMAVIGTKAEYFTSVWVKNEWGRFLKLMETHPEKNMFFACDNPEELPRAFATKQAQILGKADAIKNLAANMIMFLKGSAPEKNTDSEYMTDQEVFDQIIKKKTKDYLFKIEKTDFKEQERNIMKEAWSMLGFAQVTKNLYTKSFHIGAICLIISELLSIDYVNPMNHRFGSSSTGMYIYSAILTIIFFAGLMGLFSSIISLNFFDFRKPNSDSEEVLLIVFAHMGTVILAALLAHLVIFSLYPFSNVIMLLVGPLAVLLVGLVRWLNPSFINNKKTCEQAGSMCKRISNLEGIAKKEFLDFAAEQLDNLKQSGDIGNNAEVKDYHYDEIKPTVRKIIEEDILSISKIDNLQLDTNKEIIKRLIITVIYSLITGFISAGNFLVIITHIEILLYN